MRQTLKLQAVGIREKCSGECKFHPFSKYLLTSCSVPSTMLPFFFFKYVKVNKRDMISAPGNL